jgi:peptidoglycan hydrolase-like protein with peptidoglycan-binding domain
LKVTGALDAQTRARLAERRREHVVQLQNALKETGHDPGPADGILGSHTKAAVRRYASAPAPSSQSGAPEVIERLRRAYEASPQSP